MLEEYVSHTDELRLTKTSLRAYFPQRGSIGEETRGTSSFVNMLRVRARVDGGLEGVMNLAEGDSYGHGSRSRNMTGSRKERTMIQCTSRSMTLRAGEVYAEANRRLGVDVGAEAEAHCLFTLKDSVKVVLKDSLACKRFVKSGWW